MMVSYSNNGDWVTIKQKAEDRAVKIFMEAFSEEQKRNFVLMMDAWEERPDQGIVQTIRRRTAHCFTFARLVDLTSKGYSVCSVPTDLPRMRVGADVDTSVQDFVDSVKEVLAMVCSHSTQRVSIVVAVIAIFVAFNLYIT